MQDPKKPATVRSWSRPVCMKTRSQNAVSLQVKAEIIHVEGFAGEYAIEHRSDRVSPPKPASPQSQGRLDVLSPRMGVKASL
jgi:hypothetical protein